MTKDILAGLVKDRDYRSKIGICYSHTWFKKESDARAYAATVKGTVNGGWLHGMKLGSVERHVLNEDNSSPWWRGELWSVMD